MTGPAFALESILGLLDRLEIAYFIGGSAASSSYGMPRLTNDIDIVMELEGVDIAEFCESLSSDFYVDHDAVTEGAKSGRPFNVIHLASAFKFDFFPVVENAFCLSELSRVSGRELSIASAEDILLAKLVWYRRGGEISERQWHDILGILRVQRNRLDNRYLTEWAANLGVQDLLLRLNPHTTGPDQAE